MYLVYIKQELKRMYLTFSFRKRRPVFIIMVRVNNEILGKRKNKPHQGLHAFLFPNSLLTGLASAVNPAFWFRNTPFPTTVRGLLALGTFLLRKALESQERPAELLYRTKDKSCKQQYSDLFGPSCIITLCCVNNRPS